VVPHLSAGVFARSRLSRERCEKAPFFLLGFVKHAPEVAPMVYTHAGRLSLALRHNLTAPTTRALEQICVVPCGNQGFLTVMIDHEFNLAIGNTLALV
jgi:hypothetical protein